METYLLINIIFIAGVWLAFRIRPRKPTRVWVATLISLLVLTAIFDSVLVGLDIVGYDTEKVLGVYVGNAPIEDFCYAILAAILIPTAWLSFKEKK